MVLFLFFIFILFIFFFVSVTISVLALSTIKHNYCQWSALQYVASSIHHLLLSDKITTLTATPGGATRMARGGIRLVHGHTKNTLITYFTGMKIDPKYAFSCIFLNLSVMSFPKFVYMTKNTPYVPILHVFAPLNDVRAYSASSWKTTL